MHNIPALLISTGHDCNFLPYDCSQVIAFKYDLIITDMSSLMDIHLDINYTPHFEPGAHHATEVTT